MTKKRNLKGFFIIASIMLGALIILSPIRGIHGAIELLCGNVDKARNMLSESIIGTIFTFSVGITLIYTYIEDVYFPTPKRKFKTPALKKQWRKHRIGSFLTTSTIVILLTPIVVSALNAAWTLEASPISAGIIFIVLFGTSLISLVAGGLCQLMW